VTTPVRWARLAEQDLTKVYKKLAKVDLERAERFLEEIQEGVDVIAMLPRAYRERAELAQGLRVCPHGAWLIVYRVDDEGVFVGRVLPARSNWQKVLRTNPGIL
jgi:plasmid stabilization system protein ParE